MEEKYGKKYFEAIQKQAKMIGRDLLNDVYSIEVGLHPMVYNIIFDTLEKFKNEIMSFEGLHLNVKFFESESVKKIHEEEIIFNPHGIKWENTISIQGMSIWMSVFIRKVSKKGFITYRDVITETEVKESGSVTDAVLGVALSGVNEDLHTSKRTVWVTHKLMFELIKEINPPLSDLNIEETVLNLMQFKVRCIEHTQCETSRHIFVTIDNDNYSVNLVNNLPEENECDFIDNWLKKKVFGEIVKVKSDLKLFNEQVINDNEDCSDTESEEQLKNKVIEAFIDKIGDGAEGKMDEHLLALKKSIEGNDDKTV